MALQRIYDTKGKPSKFLVIKTEIELILICKNKLRLVYSVHLSVRSIFK